jgi:hypothetical protein
MMNMINVVNPMIHPQNHHQWLISFFLVYHIPVDFKPTITGTYIFIYGYIYIWFLCSCMDLYIYPCYTQIYIYYKTWFGACDNGRLSEIIHVCL